MNDNSHKNIQKRKMTIDRTVNVMDPVPDDIVIIVDSTAPRGSWLMG